MELELHTLPNGVRVALDPMPGIGTAALGVWQRVGARWEPAAINGVAHLFEHMAFKGAGPRDARKFAEDIENVGGVMNAATSYERTSYYARVLAEHAPFALDMIADILLAPHWNADDLEKEKGVVAQERGEAFDVPDDRVFELHQAALYPNQPLGRPVLGEENTLANISVETLEAFRHAHMSPERVIVSIAGAYHRAAFLEAAERRFGGIAAKPTQERAAAQAFAGEAREMRKLEQAHVVFSWPAPAAGSPDGFAARLLAEIFGGGMASRLFQEVRETRGLVYTIDSFLDTYEDDGRLAVYAGCNAGNARAVAEIVRAELAAIADKGVTNEELARAKAIARAQLLMGLEAPSSRAGARAAQAFLYGRLIPEAEISARIEAVQPEALQKLAATALKGPGCISVIGPKAGHGVVEAFQAD